MGFRSFLHRLTAPKPSHRYGGGEPVKLVCVVNQSLKMGKGKIAAQVGHASVQAFLNGGVSHPSEIEAWLASGQKKICLKTPEVGDFETLQKEAQRRGIPSHIVHDAGHTQIPRGSATVLALGPFDESVLDELTGHLKLL
jgi:PTH2 family peptidyl-tRNA hydrolase